MKISSILLSSKLIILIELNWRVMLYHLMLLFLI